MPNSLIANDSTERGMTAIIQLPSESTGDFRADERFDVRTPANIPILTESTPNKNAWRLTDFSVVIIWVLASLSQSTSTATKAQSVCTIAIVMANLSV
jgi:hypothetical protein